MSRIGKKVIEVPEGVNVEINGQNVFVKGSRGELSLDIHHKVRARYDNNNIYVERKSDDKLSRSLHGLTQRLISNMIKGVKDGFARKLEIKGVGYRASLNGNKLTLALGFSHPVEVDAPEGIEFQVQKNIIVVSGIDKQLVGQIAANIRSLKKPEPYKGKGIKYLEEIIIRKAGKAAKAAGAQGA
ncbi:50S ribosomal protein L6 [Candidatus Berkelbacteria bacterium RIFCSPHIGHO2_12_FULL_36_9]|uniref:Large ribosomal subunit protein uL6 n=1 Tax=Candidatus Berkelbacteria bacterium RIFCSPHIGHO2_12_FULL_36_9 TaxID=1797469 RepID=A0A1F5EDM0_9BACT|nr:MAG: 50S ribosomal protein L6 [Candidatus Berkelbacteria bacterium RIFCSPHIGHO2_12_FULL_36_9]